MQNSYLAKRASLENYFNEVSSDAWDKLTSNEPCLLYTSPSPRDEKVSRMPSSA